MKYLGEFNNRLHHFPSYTREYGKKHIKLTTKIKTYKIIVIPCIHYGAETWNCSRKQISKLNGIQYRQLRTILGKIWRNKISHVDILYSVKFGTNKKFQEGSTRC